MDGLIDFLASVNKISLLAFLGVLGFLIYEVYLLRRDHLKKQKPSIPQFNTNTVINKETVQQQAIAVAPLKKAVQEKRTKTPPLLVIILVLMTFFFIGFSIYTVITRSKEAPTNITPQVIVREVSSPGL